MNAKMPGGLFLSVATPAFNEEHGIEAVLMTWCAYLENQPWIDRFEIVVADDGSSDTTAQIVREIATRGFPIRLVSLKVNGGAGVALRAAVRATKAPWVLLMDSDGQFDIRDMETMYDAALSLGADLVVGNRIGKADSTILRVGSYISNALVARAIGALHVDTNSAMKLIRGPLVRGLPLEARHLNYSSDVLAKAAESGARIIPVPVRHSRRAAGTSSARVISDGLARALFTGYCLYRSFLVRHGTISPATLAYADCSCNDEIPKQYE